MEGGMRGQDIHRPAVVLEGPEEGTQQSREVGHHRRLVDLHEQLRHADAGRLPHRVVVGLGTPHVVAHHLQVNTHQT